MNDKGHPTSNNDLISVEYMHQIAIITLNRPSKRNALNRDARLKLSQLLIDLGADTNVSAIILASRETAFSAGQDLAEAKDFSVSYISEWIDEHMMLYSAILSYPRPILAAVDGCCVGAGFQIALLCDLRIGSNQAFFAMPEIDDAIPCILGIWTLWDVIGRSRTTEMVLTNRQVPAEEALEWGILNRITSQEDLLPEVLTLALALVKKPALAYRLTKERLRLLLVQEAESVAAHASFAHAIAFESGEPQKAMTAFLNKDKADK